MPQRLQRAGDVLYLPPQLSHSTLSLSDTVAVSFPVVDHGEGELPTCGEK